MLTRTAFNRAAARATQVSAKRWASAAANKDNYKVVVIGAGAGGLTVANQIYNRFSAAGKSLNEGDIAILDAAQYHNYQPGWTLVGAGLKHKSELRRPMASLIPDHIAHIPENVQSFSPKSNAITTTSGRTISYESLVVATGLQSNWDAIPGLSKGLADPRSGVSSIYSYDTCDKVWNDIDALRSGTAVFTQPAGIIKCAGAPQKIMWMAWDRYRQTERGDNIKIDFYTGMPTMFSVKKYSDALDKLRVERGVGGHFQHNLTSIDVANRRATFKKVDGTDAIIDYTLLHVVPPMGPLNVMKGQPIADAAGWVDVNKETLQHTNPEFSNVWAIGDCTSLPTSKTAAAITAQAPILTENLFSFVNTGKLATDAKYDGYTSCPLLTGYGQLMLAEFKYGLEPKETFSNFVDQTVPQRAFYHLKKDFFPWVYFNAMLQGRWYGSAGPIRPKFAGL
ncbi:FAD/NAD(P)-binding domain-containing protein [Punctularia strigosozonata HHB-11173 SS5]|uniref:FAD/NAD(P)-binding domain-containing protein n=1 Tax=Punctularia strigosozonata (strain HHB-11173) TaxID=741275 RepID=UPI00044167B7|nr:FAD/NAD(P)-binding domain-containing protein [Punctularia strigosozonata HHB-11173 SS5]EIN07400.1 FAD/NAD(P)-binding domain-containing protein [Punctularia strigosozonata HHB-11173 SS5]